MHSEVLRIVLGNYWVLYKRELLFLPASVFCRQCPKKTCKWRNRKKGCRRAGESVGNPFTCSETPHPQLAQSIKEISTQLTARGQKLWGQRAISLHQQKMPTENLLLPFFSYWKSLWITKAQLETLAHISDEVSLSPGLSHPTTIS